MESNGRKPTLVIGVGNRYRSDDGVGPVVASKLGAMNLPSVVACEESGEGAALMEAWKGAEHVIIIDAASSGSLPGTLHTINAQSQRIPSSFFHYSSHAFSVAEAIELARALGQLPPHLVLFGIEGKDFDAGLGLSPEVERSSEEVLRLMTEQLTTSAIGYVPAVGLLFTHVVT
jgi:hydrogenase maturation protease